MADKFRKVVPIKITFSDGEAPTSSKLNSGFNQVRNGLSLLERAIGDPWNQSGEATLTDNTNIFPLQIPNISRLIGANAYLNPVWVPVGYTFQYTDHIGSRFAGQTTGYLRFRPASTPTALYDPATFSGAPKATERLVVAMGDWWYDSTTGKFRTAGPINSSATLVYNVNPTSTWHAGLETLPAVIPDPGQSIFTSCRIESSGGKYYLHLPPRAWLTGGKELPENYPTGETEQQSNRDGVGGGTKKYIGYGGIGDPYEALVGTGDEVYRYPLPHEITEGMTLTEGTVIPQGLLLLWDENTKSIIEDVVFKWPDASREYFALEVSSNTYNFLAVATIDETDVSYNLTGLKLITCGSPITRTLNTLMGALYNHSHKNEGTGEPVIAHKDLTGLNPPPPNYSGHLGRYPTTVSGWAPSNWADDDHTYLLSRVGSVGVSGSRNRDINDNAMLGHLLLASKVASGGNYLNTSADSWALYFGDTVNGPNIYRQNAFGKALALDGSLRINGYQLTPALTVVPGSSFSVAGINVTGGLPDGDAITASGVGYGNALVATSIDGPAILVTVADGATARPYGLEVYGGSLTASTANGGSAIYALGGTMYDANDGFSGGTGVTGKGGDTWGSSIQYGGIGVKGIAGIDPINAAGIGVKGLADATYGGYGVWGDGGTASTGVGGYFYAENGYGLKAASKYSAPVRSAFRIEPQGSAPSNKANGDMFVDPNGYLWMPDHVASAWQPMARKTFAYGAQAGGSRVQGTSTNETRFPNTASVTIPASLLNRVGGVIRIRANGNVANVNATGTLTLYVRLGGSSGEILFNTNGGAGISVNTNDRWTIDLSLVIQSTGVSGYIVGSSYSALGSGTPTLVATGTGLTINTTVDKEFWIAAKWSAVDAGDTVDLYSVVVELL